MSDRVKVGNDELILYIRKNYPQCRYRNESLGKLIWIWIRGNADGRKLFEEPQPCRWGNVGDFISEHDLPKDATQFDLLRTALPALYDELDRLGSEI